MNRMTFCVCVLAACLAAATLPGCSSATIAAKESIFGIAKRDQLVARVQDAKEEQANAKKQFESALAEFMAVTGTKGKLGDLEAKYDKLKSATERSASRAKAVTGRIDDVETVAKKLFDEWQGELSQYSDSKLRYASEKQLADTKYKYAQLIGKMRAAEAKMTPVLKSLQEHTLFLKHNLNAAAIASLEGVTADVQTEISALVKDMEASIAEATQFIDQMQAGK